MSFESRYTALNRAQKEAVDHIEGPLMVVAGPGTGKTELLSMRAANILQKTDALPSNILCLTFTESGATAMRERLKEIIGADAYKIAIHTFHSFGSDVISRNGDYFYNNAYFQPASDLAVYQLVRDIFDSLQHDSPLATTMNGEFTHLNDTITAISELKKSGLTSDELLIILDDNERVLDECETALGELFADRISSSTKDKLAPIAMRIAELDQPILPAGITPLANTLALSISHAVDDADDTDSTKPITAWRNKWLEKNSVSTFIFKDRKRIKKLREISYIYYQYLLKMQEKELYDFDDMVLRVVHALEVFDDLRFNLQEQYTYIMVDEFQDTNLAQARILRNLASNPANEGAPNLMVVGDDDQAIYSFQGAEISNILDFKGLYETTKQIVLSENYRSAEPILTAARSVITQGSDRLEHRFDDINKSLSANHKPKNASIELREYQDESNERLAIAQAVAEQIKKGTKPDEIAVLARRHHELVALLPYFADAGVQVNYERRENILEHEVILQLELLARVVQAIANEQHEKANALLPELLSHPAWHIEPLKLWQLSLDAHKQGRQWLEMLGSDESLQPLHSWLLEQAMQSLHTPLEPLIDVLLGVPRETEATFISPLYAYFFDTKQHGVSQDYLTVLDALSTLRSKLREYSTAAPLMLDHFLEFIALHQSIGSTITAVRTGAHDAVDAIHLMTAHKSKGREFDSVYICGAVDSAWGERVRTRVRAVSYPRNLPLAPSGDSYDERLRLFFVAMTRARSHLTISYSRQNDTGKALECASFLLATSLKPKTFTLSVDNTIKSAELAWYAPLVSLPHTNTRELLAPSLEHYTLSATHLNNFIDITRGGPETFLLNNLLRFPQSISPNAAYGSAVHQTLQRAHTHFASQGKRRPIEDLLSDFEANLKRAPLSEKDYTLYLARGVDYLQQFLQQHYENFSTSQQAEVNFRHQGVQLGDARLSGSLDVIDIDAEHKTIAIIDYKTGKPASSWQGKTDFEKIKLHKYRQQLMFYHLLVQHSRDFSHLAIQNLSLQFVEPDTHGDFSTLSFAPTKDELETFSKLIQAIWSHIQTLDFPDISQYSQDYKGILAFEKDLLA